MPNTTVYTNNQYYQDIAAAIRFKNGQTTSYKPSEMAPAIMALVVGTISLQPTVTVNPSTSTQTITASAIYDGLSSVVVNAIQTETKTVTVNGTVTPSTGKYLTAVTVNVPVGAAINNQDKTVTPSESVQTVSADTGYTGLGTVTVHAISSTYIGSEVTQQAGSTIIPTTQVQIAVPANVYTTGAIQIAAIPSNYIVPTGTVTITSNGTTDVTSYASVVVNVPTGGTVTNTTTTITPTEQRQTSTPPTGYTGFSSVTVEPIPSEYLVPTGTLTVTTNGTFNIGSYASVYVNVPTSTGPGVGGMISHEEQDPAGGTVMIIDAVDLSLDTVDPAHLVSGYTAHDSTGAAIVGTFSGQIINNQNKTVTSSTVTQVLSAGSGYTGLGTVTINAIATAAQASPAITINSSGLISATATQAAGYVTAGTITTTSQLSTKSGTTITPSTATQTAIAANTYATGAITVAPIPSNYITTSDATATAAQILKNQTAYVNGAKVTGTMTNNGATGGTIASQGGTYTIPAGYTSGGTVTASLPVSTITNGALNVATVTEATNDYGVEAKITIPTGYYNTTTLTVTLSNILPAPATAAVVSQILAGYEAYNYQGQLLAGTMTNRGAVNVTLNDTLTSTTIAAGYHNGSGTVSHTTVNIPDPTITLSQTTGIITASASWTKGFTTDNSYSATLNLTTKGAQTYTPGTATQTITSGRYLTGNQTIAGDANLVGGNIISTVSIFGVQGTLVVSDYYTGTTAPASSLGNNGDIYLQT